MDGLNDAGLDHIDLEEGAPAPRAPHGMRYVGVCRACKDFVELDKSFGCKAAGHGREFIGAAELIGKGDPLPRLPKMNWGAFLMPALWGPAHGQWYLILMYPIWLFLDNIIYTAVWQGGWYVPLAALCLAVMVAFMAMYGRGANTFAYLRVAQTRTLEEYLSRERVWTCAMAAIALVFVVFATWYNLAVRPGLG